MKNLRLKAARAALDMSQAELAKRVNVSRQTIVAIEKVWANPDYANNELGWKAQETLEDTLRSAWAWQLKLRERGIQ